MIKLSLRGRLKRKSKNKMPAFYQGIGSSIRHLSSAKYLSSPEKKQLNFKIICIKSTCYFSPSPPTKIVSLSVGSSELVLILEMQVGLPGSGIKRGEGANHPG